MAAAVDRRRDHTVTCRRVGQGRRGDTVRAGSANNRGHCRPVSGRKA
ncbi:hypothetical protein yruck0001_34760, partial [Yersinia ruckeri ATCC 29473]